MGEERSEKVQALVNEVFALFVPLARCDWLMWGGELLFADLQEQVEREEQEAEAARVREWEEEACRAAEEARKTKIDARRAVLAKARAEVLDGFRAKTISMEELQRRDTEFVAEADAIKRAEAGEDEEGEEELPEIVVAKWKAAEVDDDDTEDEDELEEKPKRPKLAEGGLLEFEGAVSYSNFVPTYRD